MCKELLQAHRHEQAAAALPSAAACSPTTVAAVMTFNANEVVYDERGTKALVPSMMYVWKEVKKNNGDRPLSIMDMSFPPRTRPALREHVHAISVAPFYGYIRSNGEVCSVCASKSETAETSLESTLMRCMGWARLLY